MNNHPRSRRSIRMRRAVSFVCALIMMLLSVPGFSAADAPDPVIVRVGYYEQELFEEGAAPNAVKSGYAYEYYASSQNTPAGNMNTSTATLLTCMICWSTAISICWPAWP